MAASPNGGCFLRLKLDKPEKFLGRHIFLFFLIEQTFCDKFLVIFVEFCPWPYHKDIAVLGQFCVIT